MNVFGTTRAGVGTNWRKASLVVAVRVAMLVVIATALGWLVGSGGLRLLLGAALAAGAYYVALKWPVVAATIVLLLSGGYTAFSTTPGFQVEAMRLGGGAYVVDVFLLGLLMAGLTRIAYPEGRRRMGRLLMPATACGAWLALETLRNVATAGVSAPGELRTRYLILAVAFGLVTGVDREALVRVALKAFVLVAVALPLGLLPVVLHLKGWSFSTTDRIFPANVSLGLVLGLTILWVFRIYLRWPLWLMSTASVLGALEIMLDAHRSVWLSACVLVAILLLVEARLQRTLRWAVLGLAATVVTTLVALGLGYDVVGTVAARGEAALHLQDTTAWRVGVWGTSLQDFAASPIIGRGLGLYFDMYVPGFGRVTVFPHSLYVLLLVHLGLVGLILFIWLFAAAWRTCASGLRGAWRGFAPSGVGPLCAYCGLGVLGVILAYGVGYGLEPYSVTLAGICLAGASGAGSSWSARSATS